MAASKIARLDADLEPSTNRGGSVRRVTLATAASMVATDGAWPAAAIVMEETEDRRDAAKPNMRRRAHVARQGHKEGTPKVAR